jgi:Rps23 Pro-64 3,4-dihydroxylase Tpa1-like proline 4-hydroxylase
MTNLKENVLYSIMNFHDAYIMEFENAFPDYICDKFIHACETNEIDHQFMLRRNRVDMSSLHKLKTSVDVPLNISKREQSILNNVYHELIKEVKIKYANSLIDKGLDKKPYDEWSYNTADFIKKSLQSDALIQKSDIGQYYNWHNDWSPREDRLLTCILYLNNLEEDAGGNTEFSSGKVIKPQKGKVLIFPSTISYVHRGGVVKKGPKYIIATFSVYNPSQHHHE